MTLLLDTHVVLWWRIGGSRLTSQVRRAIASADVALVSAASGWEVALKLGIGKLKLGQPFASMVEQSGFTELPIALAHAERVVALPRRHRDPFDRMLVAQAQVEGAMLVTHDGQFRLYDVPTLWV